MPLFRRRTKPLAPELAEASAEFQRVFWEALGPPLLRYAEWFDRQLRRWPRLYRWLSR